ncbi:MAG TPA: LytTR family DNA-binding domain-containing protein [Kofleriaceae bacterium]|jgi:two-component system LytT family response regulator|nr:LytTR family DNA-binding domain-containing protein [Kofleriaceae bacterium]
MRVVIADDEPLGRLALRQLVAAHADVEIAGEACDGREAIDVVRRVAPDLLLLDVEMPELDGFDVLAELAPAIPPTIFVTAHDTFAVKAFEAHALDYVVKPVGQARFDTALARVRDAIAKDRAAELGKRAEELLAGRALERLVARLGDRSTVIAVDDIDWIEAQDYCAAVHVGDATHVVRHSLAALEARLDARRFVRIHRSAVVNVARIRELDHADASELVVVLSTGARLPVSRRRREALERVLGAPG